ncbi:MAG: hypothetical protein GX364_04820 [Firmicutes bacterium]|jgi:hypothetical protein|nr:hypothetical protein [Bacillota bacterium]
MLPMPGLASFPAGASRAGVTSQIGPWGGEICFPMKSAAIHTGKNSGEKEFLQEDSIHGRGSLQVAVT